MRSSTAPRVAFSLVVLYALLVGAAMAIASRNGAIPDGGVIFVGMAVYALVGGLVAARRPRNPIGWLAALGVTFFAGLVLLQGLLRPITGANEIGVALSTLVSFTLFQPFRRRIQSAVDQRFDRHKVDTERTLEVFSSRLGDEIDIDAFRGDLVAAVRSTMAPQHVSLWLRGRER